MCLLTRKPGLGQRLTFIFQTMSLLCPWYAEARREGPADFYNGLLWGLRAVSLFRWYFYGSIFALILIVYHCNSWKTTVGLSLRGVTHSKCYYTVKQKKTHTHTHAHTPPTHTPTHFQFNTFVYNKQTKNKTKHVWKRKRRSR